jgi:hypothetical protein
LDLYERVLTKKIGKKIFLGRMRRAGGQDNIQNELKETGHKDTY